MYQDPAGCGARVSRAELRKRKVIDTARKLFIENGFHATGIAQIARESGVAVAQIYRDFASKEDIVAALVQVDCIALMCGDPLNAAIRAGNKAEVLKWVHQFIEPDDDLEGNRLFAEIVAESSRNERIAAIFTAVQDEFRPNLLAALALLAPGAELAREREVLADAIATISLGLLHHQLMRPVLDVEPLVEAFKQIVDQRIDALNAAGDRTAERTG